MFKEIDAPQTHTLTLGLGYSKWYMNIYMYCKSSKKKNMKTIHTSHHKAYEHSFRYLSCVRVCIYVCLAATLTWVMWLNSRVAVSNCSLVDYGDDTC